MVAGRLQAVDAILERRIVEIGNPAFDSVIEPLQAQLGFGGALVQLGDMLAATLGTILPPIEDSGQHILQPVGIEQPFFQMLRDEIIEPLHRDGHAAAGGRALPRPHRAGVIAIAPALAGADRHCAAALPAMDQSGQQRRAADHLWVRHFGAARFQMRLHRVERRLVDDRRHLDSDDFIGRLQRLRLPALVELVPPGIGRAGQQSVNRADAPAPAVAGEDAALVEIFRDRLDAHRPGGAVTLQRELERQPHRVGVQRVDLQLLLGLRAALFGRDHTIADRWQRAVPEALPCILFQRAQDVLGVFLRLIFVEQRHDLAHHDVHRVVAHLLRDGQQLHAVLGELADVELQLEMIAEEAREAVDDYNVEWRGLARPGLDHPLELGPAIIGGGRTGFDERLDQRKAARQAIAFALLALVGDRHIMLGLPRGRNTQVEGGAKLDGHGSGVLTSLARP